MAKLDLMDAYAADRGFLDEQGNPPAFAGFYVSALNSARLALARLEEHLARAEAVPDPLEALVVEGRALLARQADGEGGDG